VAHASGYGLLTQAELIVARRPRSAATRGAGRRNRQGLLSASSGAQKAPLACEDRYARGCARASISGCKKSTSGAKVQRSAFPPATGGVDGDLTRNGSQEPARVKRRRLRSVRRPSRSEGKVRSRALERAPRGNGPRRTKDIPGHHPTRHGLHAGVRTVASAALRAAAHARAEQLPAGDATGMPEARPHTPRREEDACRGPQNDPGAARRSESF